MDELINIEPAPACPVCDGAGAELGMLGDLTHYRCRDCGWIFNLRICGNIVDMNI